VTRIVAVGDLMTDVVAVASEPLAPGSDTRARVRLSGGGSAANTAAWLAATGADVAYVGRAGDDLLGRAAVDELAAAGVDVRVALDPALPTGTCVVVATPDGHRSMFPDTGANAALAPEHLPPDLFDSGAHLHLSGYTLLGEGCRPAAFAALAMARATGMTVSVDPASVGPLRAVGVELFLGWTAGADLLLANEDEARLLTGAGDALAAGRTLAASYGAVVVKLGAGGAAWFHGEDVARVAAVPAEVVDSTGAGDCFAAGFLPLWLAGAPPVEALTAGCALAARVVSTLGARPGR
jgi:sugar/nucleoside kinase (ribokinase family)